ncbi:Serine-aspartate repeat-containing protein F, partial [Ophiophagus hannah]
MEIQRSDVLRRGPRDNLNSTNVDQKIVVNPAHKNEQKQNKDGDHQGGGILVHLKKQHVTAGKASTDDAISPYGGHPNAKERQLLQDGIGLAQTTSNSQYNTQENLGHYLKSSQVDLFKKINVEENYIEDKRESNAVLGPASTTRSPNVHETDSFPGKQYSEGSHSRNGLKSRKDVDVFSNDHYSFDSFNLYDEGIQGDDPGYADDSDSGESDSNQQPGAPSSSSDSDDEESEQSSHSANPGSPDDIQSSTCVHM